MWNPLGMSATDLRLLCLGDNHGDIASLERVLDHASLGRFDLVVHTGDLTDTYNVGPESGRQQLEAVESVLERFERHCPVLYVWGDRDEIKDGPHVTDGVSVEVGTHVPADDRLRVADHAFTQNPGLVTDRTVLVTHEFRPYLVSNVDGRAYVSGHTPSGRHAGNAVSTPLLNRAQGRYEAGGYLAVELATDGSVSVELRNLGGLQCVDCDRHGSLGRQYTPAYMDPACRFAYREFDYYYEHATRAVYAILRDGDRPTVGDIVERVERAADADDAFGDRLAAFLDEYYAGQLHAFERRDGELYDALRARDLERAGPGDAPAESEPAVDDAVSGPGPASTLRSAVRRLLDRDGGGWRTRDDDAVPRPLDTLHYHASARTLERLTAQTDTTHELLDAADEFEGFGRYRTLAPVQDREELVELVERLQRRGVETVVEIGAGHGGVAYALSNCVDTVSTVVSVDLNHTRERRRFLQRFVDADEVALVAGDSRDTTTVASVAAHLDGQPVDFLFVDGGGMYDDVTADFERYLPLVADDGVVGLHDIVTYRRHPDFAEQHLLWHDLQDRYATEEILRTPHQDVYGIGLVYP
jgi:predicted O-methyltransferase YrrM/predicted phosphodiesterase